jgi:peptidyl-prolyl cis-trans isomerase C
LQRGRSANEWIKTRVKAAIVPLLKRCLTEPLVHFVLIGVVIFALFGSPDQAADRSITIESTKINQLVQGFNQTWRRLPTNAELDGLIRDYVEEEVYYREALRLGLDTDDPVIRRRLRAKMEFLASSEAENATPSDSELRAWIAQNQGRYATEARYSFDQIYLHATGPDPRTRAQTLLAQLNAGGDPRFSGDMISLPRSVKDAAQSDVEKQFGSDFAKALPGLATGRWAGPVTSGFGLHLVRITSVEKSAAAPLSVVRQQVENDWRSFTKSARAAKAYQTLLDAYDVKIEKPQ